MNNFTDRGMRENNLLQFFNCKCLFHGQAGNFV